MLALPPGELASPPPGNPGSATVPGLEIKAPVISDAVPDEV